MRNTNSKAVKAMNEEHPVEKHPFEPFLPVNARLLMLGTFPPAQAAIKEM